MVTQAENLAWQYGLRGYDAIHLATALTWQEALKDKVVVGTFDQALWQVAKRVGLDVFPSDLAGFVGTLITEELVDIVVKQGNIAQEPAELIVVNLFQGVTLPGGATGAVNGALGGMIRDVLGTGDFTGKAGETIVLYTRGAIPAPRVLIVGLGDAARFDLQGVRNASATAARKARELGVKHFATIVHGAGIGGLDPQQAAQAVAEGALLGLYRYEGYRSKPPKDWKPDPEKMTVLEFGGERKAAFEAGVARGAAIAAGVNLARHLVNTPANHMTPTVMAEAAEALARETGLEFDALGRAECKALGMGIFMAVAEESEEDPKLIVLEHNKGMPELPTVVLVGKGVTFDSGGISIKPGEEMWKMKGDMAGAAAVIAALGVAARLKLPLHVVGSRAVRREPARRPRAEAGRRLHRA